MLITLQLYQPSYAHQALALPAVLCSSSSSSTICPSSSSSSSTSRPMLIKLQLYHPSQLIKLQLYQSSYDHQAILCHTQDTSYPLPYARYKLSSDICKIQAILCHTQDTSYPLSYARYKISSAEYARYKRSSAICKIHVTKFLYFTVIAIRYARNELIKNSSKNYATEERQNGN